MLKLFYGVYVLAIFVLGIGFLASDQKPYVSDHQGSAHSIRQPSHDSHPKENTADHYKEENDLQKKVNAHAEQELEGHH